MTRHLVSLATAAMLAACASTPSAPAVPDAPNAAIPSSANDTCGASMYAELIGKPIDGRGVPGESRLNRHITPGSQVTADYVAQRMNIEAGEDGMIKKINCG
ncbi:MAG: I78 family peptidase inhibitor [Hyphomonadaceae bacterium]